jgi:hypothetical protein
MICKTNFYRLLITATIIVGGIKMSYSQSSLPSINSVVPVSPNAASLGKYGEIPVGFSTGIPNISVPIFDIQSGSLKMPVNISYHAGGMRVEEVASWVGLGWSLNAGGVITRQVRGIADENANGYRQNYLTIDSFINNLMPNAVAREAYRDAVNSGAADSQQDLFTYNIGGESGKLVFMPGGGIVSIPVSKNKFEFGTFLGQDSCWKITGTDGTVYYFSDKENSSATSVTNGSAGSTLANISSWYLSRMVNVTGKDSISFSYNTSFSLLNTGNAQTKYVLDPVYGAGCTGKSPDVSYSLTNVLAKQPSLISFSNGTVQFFEKSADRDDYPNNHALDSIVITNTDGSYRKKYRFYQSYNTGSGNYGTPSEELKRMFLDSMVIFDATTRQGKYGFSYNLFTTLPFRNSYDQDHWGYFNNAGNGVDFVPSSNLRQLADSNYLLIAGANRNPDSVLNQLGTLTSIIYPTGGRTEFEYETNKICNLESVHDLVTGYGSFVKTTSYSGSFNINDDFAGSGGVNATISINNGGSPCTLGASLGCPVVTISGPSGNLDIYDNIERWLRKGTYSVTVDLSGVTDPDIISNFSFSVVWAKSALSDSFFKYNANAGGLRIKKITNYSSTTGKASVKKYLYKNPADLGKSSGYLVCFPEYISKSFFYSDVANCGYFTLSSGSNYPLLTTQGSYVNYKYVQELSGENGEFGKAEYEFTAPDIYPTAVDTHFPFAPAEGRDFRRGHLLNAKAYSFNTGTQAYTLVDEKINTYTDIFTNQYQGVKIGLQHFHSETTPPYLKGYDSSRFAISSGWFPQASETHRVYDQNNPSVYSETVTLYGYDSLHYLPITVSTTNSKGEDVIQHMKYPLDYTSLSGSDNLTAGITNLKNKNLVSPVIEKYTQIGGDSRTTQATFTSYKPTVALPDTIYSAELTVATTSFSASSVSSGSITKSGLYQSQVAFNKYDSYGNIAEQQKLKDAKHSYLWDYSASYPVAEVTNADSGNIAYTSFENGVTGNWTVSSDSGTFVTNTSPTGNKYYTFSGSTLQKTGLSSGATYIVSYWSSTGTYYTVSGTISSSKTGAIIGGWTYCEHEVTGTSSITVSGSGNIDELRLYPKNALMTTYTYQPLAGMTSQCDAANKITYYQYDSLGRLQLMKDQYGNILKSFDYKYQQ